MDDDRRSTFLELCNIAASFTKDHGTGNRGELTEFTGELSTLPRHISDAWDDLCNSRPDWLFLREDNYITNVLRSGSNIQLVKHLLGDDAKDFANWNESGVFRVIYDGEQEFFCRLMDYEKLRRSVHGYDGGAGIHYISIMPSFDLYVMGAPVPEHPVTLRVDWYRRANALLNKDDRMNLPRQYENAVIHRALTQYFQAIKDDDRYELSMREYLSTHSHLVDRYVKFPNFRRVRGY